MTNSDPRERILDASERILARNGRAGLTTRRIAAEAGLNHGLVHYHFGSIQTVELATALRFFPRLIAARTKALEGAGPFAGRWQECTRALAAEIQSGDARIDAELRALAWDRAELRALCAEAADQWRSVLDRAFRDAAAEYGLTAAAVDPMATLVATFTTGMSAERLAGITAGHAALLDWVQGVIESLAGSGAHGEARAEAEIVLGDAAQQDPLDGDPLLAVEGEE